MKQKFYEKVLEQSDLIGDKWLEQLTITRGERYKGRISKEMFEATNAEFVAEIFTSIEQGGSPERLKAFAEKLINLGWPLSYITDGLHAFRKVAIDFILSSADQIDTEYFSELLASVDAWIDPIVRQLVTEYSGSWEQVVDVQKRALLELSAPLIPVMDRITVMPLIGTIDTERAQLIMENLLEGVVEHDSEVVLIDITGVPIVDTMVAHHIIQAAEAVRLIGAHSILVGIRPEIAHTIVSLGIDLKDITTKSSLKKGFMTALELTNRKVVNIKEKEDTVNEMMNRLI